MSGVVAVLVALAALAVAVRAGRRAERAELVAQEVGSRPRGWVSRPAHAEIEVVEAAFDDSGGSYRRYGALVRNMGVLAAQNVSVMVCDGADTAPIGVRAYEFLPDDVRIEAGDE